MDILYKIYDSPFGKMKIASYDNHIIMCDWLYRKMRKQLDDKIAKQLSAEYVEGETPVIQKCQDQLEEYFHKERQEFDVPLMLIGTDFQKSVWAALQKIEYGRMESYLGLSRILGNEKSIRAVATANGANNIAIIIPCHRIIGADGSLTGYAGGLTTKKKLLELETPKIQLSLFEL